MGLALLGRYLILITVPGAPFKLPVLCIHCVNVPS